MYDVRIRQLCPLRMSIACTSLSVDFFFLPSPPLIVKVRWRTQVKDEWRYANGSEISRDNDRVEGRSSQILKHFEICSGKMDLHLSAFSWSPPTSSVDIIHIWNPPYREGEFITNLKSWHLPVDTPRLHCTPDQCSLASLAKYCSRLKVNGYSGSWSWSGGENPKKPKYPRAQSTIYINVLLKCVPWLWIVFQRLKLRIWSILNWLPIPLPLVPFFYSFSHACRSPLPRWQDRQLAMYCWRFRRLPWIPIPNTPPCEYGPYNSKILLCQLCNYISFLLTKTLPID